MLQIHLSQTLSKELKLHLNDAADVEPTALQWYGHKVEVDGQDCVVLMELQSRYAIVFCGMTPYHYEHFTDIVQERLWKEVCAITQLDENLPDEDVALLSDMVLDLSSAQFFQRGHNRSVTSHINQVVDHLRMLVEEDGYALPVSMNEAMQFGLIANDILRKRKEDKDYFVPLLIFRDFWLGLLDVLQNHNLTADSEAAGELSGASSSAQRNKQENVIHVDFSEGKKR